MTAIIILFAFGILLLASEVFIPGAILGAVGGLCLSAGTIVAFAAYGFATGVWIGLLGLVLTCATFWIEFSIMPRKHSLKRLSVVTATSGAIPALPANPADVVGQTCIAETILAPSGYVRIGERRFEAFCQSGHAESGTNLIVIGINSFQLVVSQST